MMYKETFQAIPYSPYITIVLCENINDARKELGLKLYDKSNWDKGTIGFYYIDTGKHRSKYVPYLFINVVKHDTVFDLFDTILHETDHLASKILQYSGVETSPDNDEAHTYLQGYMGNKIWEMYFKFQNKEFSPKLEYIEIVKKNDKEV